MTVDLTMGDTPLILEECQRRGLLRNQTAYVLATAYWETAHTMEPVREAFWLDEGWRQRELRYYPWYGRGYVQLTWEANYERMGKRLGLDLTSDPDVVMNPQTAAQILVIGMQEGAFTGKRLDEYVTLKASDYRGARRVVNGTDKAGAIAALAEDYEDALLAQGYGVEKKPPVANEHRDGTSPRSNPAKSTTVQATLIAFIAMLGQVMDGTKDVVDQITEQFGISAEMALFVVATGALAWVFRERLRKWAEGVR